jgi:hypothetical protein
VTVSGDGLTGWYQLKEFLAHSLGFSMDALHVVGGVVLQLGAAWLMRRPVADWRPLLAVLAIELANEAYDLQVERWPDPAMQYGEGAKDVLLTMLVPLVLLAVARFRPRLLTRPVAAPGAVPPATNHGSDLGAAE